MPISAKQVQAILDQESPFVKRAFEEIDRRLSDPLYARAMVYNEECNPTYKVAVVGIASNGDKEAIIAAYLKAGWGEVIVTNSSEQGERPGMVGITLKKNVKEVV